MARRRGALAIDFNGGGPLAKEDRPDRSGPHRQAFTRNKKIIMCTQNTCGICGKPVDMSLRAPNPMAPCVDHIVPVAKGGHPSDIDNLQLAHWSCNRQKSDKLYKNKAPTAPVIVGNRNLPQSMDWAAYRCP